MLRHAGPCDARVVVRYRPADVELEVRDSGRGAAGGPPGFGLAGLRERVAMVGGTIDARVEASGGFVLSARLPVAAGRP